MLMRKITCPFCDRRHVIAAHLNVLCSCGAKYYIHNGEFWDRKDGNVVKQVPYRLFDSTVTSKGEKYE